MKKILILFLIFIIILSGCKKEESIFKSQEEIDALKIEKERNKKATNEISNIIENTINVNYSFIYNILTDDIEYNYEGQKFDTVIKGKYYTFNKNINYQIEDNKVFDLDNDIIIYDLYKNIDYSLIDLNRYIDKIRTYTCTLNKSSAICQKGNNTITFVFENNYITKIEFNNGANIEYILNYNDFNNINYIEKVDYEENKIEYQKSSTIDEQTLHDELGQIYYIYNYYIKNATMEINGEKKNIIDIPEAFEKAMYNLNYDNYILENINIKQINHYIFDNNFNIITIKDDEDIWNYYLTVDEYVNNILNEYISFD